MPRAILVVLVVAAGLVTVGCERPTEHEMTTPTTGRIVESFREPARTRLARTYLVAMPVAGRIGRIELEHGDTVEQGKTLTTFDRVPLEQALAEARARLDELKAGARPEELAIARADVTGAKARLDELKAGARPQQLKMAEADVTAARAELDRTQAEFTRQQRLLDQGVASKQRYDAARTAHQAAQARLRRALEQLELSRAGSRSQQVDIAAALLDRAQQRLALLQRGARPERIAAAEAAVKAAQHALSLARIVSPISGTVLQRHHRGETALAAGTTLLTLGRMEDLEVVAEVLTEDALSLAPGSVVELTSGLLKPIRGTVSRIEPAGFTKLSTLGVEEQRVRVIVGLDQRPEGLGVGYRLDARFVTRTREDALLLPRYSVLQRPGGKYVVFVIDGDVLAEREVTLGLQSERQVEVSGGIEATTRVVAAPQSSLRAGSKARAKAAPGSN